MFDYRQLFDLTGKRALVTGSDRPSGIGAAIAKGLADFGAAVALHTKGDEPIDHTVKDAIRAVGGECELFTEDLAVPGAGKRLIEKVTNDFGDLDIVVINATTEIRGSFLDVTLEEFEIQVNVNMRSAVELLQTVLPQMSARGWGRIVNIGSINQRAPKPVVSIYAATKAAQHNLINSLAREYASHGVLLNTLAPGLVDTHPERREGDPQAMHHWDEYAKQLNWMGRAGAADEMVGAAIYLSSPACSYMTGEAIYPVGGY